MAADAFKTQAWNNTGWGWDQATAGSPCEQMLTELRGWITTINGNAAQSGKQVVLERDENSSTTADYRGFTINMPAITTTGSLYFQMFSSTTTTLQMRWGNSFTDDTSNGGYGTITSGGFDSSIGWKNTVTTEAQMNVCYGTVNGEEFFACGWALDSSTSYSDHFTLFKDINGEWAVVQNDGTSTLGWFYDPLRNTPAWVSIWGDSYAANSSIVTTPCLYPNLTGLNTGDPLTAYCVPATPDMVTWPTDTNALTYFPDGATGDVFAKINYYGPYFRYTPV